MNAPKLSPEAAALYPWKGHYLDVSGGRMHYLDEGPRDAPVLLAVHGNPTWSFYWRAVVARFSDRFRVVVPDHIGCGMSDKPADWPYRLSGHVDNLSQLIEHLDLQNIILLIHDWGGAIGSGAAERHVERMSGLLITNTSAFRGPQIPPSIALCRIPVLGKLAVQGMNGFARAATMRTTMRPLPAAVKQGLLAPYNSWSNRIATLRFVEDIPMKPSHPSYDVLDKIDTGLAKLAHLPARICWGNKDWCFTTWYRDRWQERFPHAAVASWDDVAHYVMEDAPDRTLQILEELIAEAHPAEA